MRAQAASSSGVSRSCGTAVALTNEPISMRRSPAATSRSSIATLVSVGMNGPMRLEAVARPDLDDLDGACFGLMRHRTPSWRSVSISCGFRPSMLAQDLVVVRAEARARPADRAGIVRHMRHDARMEDLSELRVLHVAAPCRARGTAGPPRSRPPCRSGCRGCRPRSGGRSASSAVRPSGPGPDDAVEFLDVLDPRRVVDEARDRAAGPAGPSTPRAWRTAARSWRRSAPTCRREHG